MLDGWHLGFRHSLTWPSGVSRPAWRLARLGSFTRLPAVRLAWAELLEGLEFLGRDPAREAQEAVALVSCALVLDAANARRVCDAAPGLVAALAGFLAAGPDPLGTAAARALSRLPLVDLSVDPGRVAHLPSEWFVRPTPLSRAVAEAPAALDGLAQSLLLAPPRARADAAAVLVQLSGEPVAAGLVTNTPAALQVPPTNPLTNTHQHTRAR